MMHCAINSTQSVCWQDGQQCPVYDVNGKLTGFVTYPNFTPTFTADWDGVSNKLSNVVGSIPQFMPFAGWPNN